MTTFAPSAMTALIDVPVRDDGYRLPLDAISAALSPHTRLVSLASPQNPAGVRFTDDELFLAVQGVRRRPGCGSAG